MKKLLVLAVVAFWIPDASATTPETIDGGEHWTISSEVLGEERSLLVALPDDYERGVARYPVLYLTDGNAHFAHTSATVQFLARAGRIPQMIVVGIPNTHRNRDLTPSRTFMTRPDGSKVRLPNSGGGDEFLEFLSTELRPFVESNFRTQPYAILAGHSLGGLLALHTLATQPDLFDAYIAVSPALPLSAHVMEGIKSLLTSRDRLDSTLVLAVGEEPRLRDAYANLIAFLESTDTQGFHWKSRHFPDEDHRSVLLPATYFGLREIYAGWMLPRDERSGAVRGGFRALREHHAKLSEKYGYEVLPSEDQIHRLGYQALSKGELETALEIFRYGVELSPESFRAHQSLGDTLEKNGDLEQALASYKKAAELAEGPQARVVLGKAKRLEDKLKAAADSSS